MMLSDALEEISARLSALASCALHICDEGFDGDAMWGLNMLLNEEMGKIKEISEAVGKLETEDRPQQEDAAP
jgi:hypothetical protein